MSASYFLDCALWLDRIDGHFEKVGYSYEPDVADVITMFKKVGIVYTGDASFVRHNGIVLLIDFATKDAGRELEDRYMELHGGI